MQFILRLPLWAMSLIQSLLVGVFVTLFSFGASYLGVLFPYGPSNPALMMMIVLSLVVLASFVCASLLLAPPIALLMDGKRSLAIKVLLLNALWLFIIAGVFIAVTYFFFRASLQ